MKKGEIYRGEKRFSKGNIYHPIVCLEDVMPWQTYFDACVLTHSKGKGGRNNIPMSEEHFLTEDENGRQYKFQYDNTHIVQQVYKKEVFWIKDRCIGRLSKAGLKFVMEHKEQFGPSIWYKKILGRTEKKA